MAPQLLLSNLAPFDSRNLVTEQQRQWVDLLKPCPALCHVSNVVSVRQQSSVRGTGNRPVFVWDAESSCPVGSTPTWTDQKGKAQSTPVGLGSADDPTTATALSEGHRQQQELLWQDFFLQPTLWWDNRQAKEKFKSRVADFSHKTSKSSLWLNNRHKPAWVELQLAMWDAGMWRPRNSVSRSPWEDGTQPGSHGGGTNLETLSRRSEQGDLQEAVEALDILVQRGTRIKESLFFSVVKRCTAEKDIVLGRRVHALVVKNGYESNAFLGNHIIGMYAAHGKLEEAAQAFSKVDTRNLHVWASIIFAHARNGRPKEAIEFYRQMRQSTVKPDNRIFVAVLEASATAADLIFGKEVHADIKETGVGYDIFVANSLVNMYVKCGSLKNARSVFDGCPAKNVVTWTAMIGGYAQHGQAENALTLYASMEHEGITPANHVTFSCLLQACASVGALQQGRQLHAQIQERGLEADVFVGNSLVTMYAKCGSLEDARIVFTGLPMKDVVTWNSMIAAYSQHGFGHEALALYASMQLDGFIPADCVTFVCLLQACTSTRNLQKGKQVHTQIRERGLESDVFVGNSLVDMYAKCGSLEYAREVFDRLPVKDVVTWNAMIAGYAQHDAHCQDALALYAGMQLENKAQADHVTFMSLLQVCATMGDLHNGKQLHAQIRQRGLEGDAAVGNCLVDMYVKCGVLEDACRVFERLPRRSVVTWTTLLSGYAKQRDGKRAIHCFEEMCQKGVKPDGATFACLLVACSRANLLHEAQLYFQVMVVDYGIKPTEKHLSCMTDLLGRSGHLEAVEKLVSYAT